MMGYFQLSERKGLLKKNSKLKVVPKKNSPGLAKTGTAEPFLLALINNMPLQIQNGSLLQHADDTCLICYGRSSHHDVDQDER